MNSKAKTLLRAALLVLLALIAGLAVARTPTAAAREFPETGYAVTNEQFLDYFDHRGGARVLGYPISREFTLRGSQVQFFQRAVLQQHPDGSVGLMNLLDEGMLPYTSIDGSTFPAPDSSVLAAAPTPADPNYAARAQLFVQANAPNLWQGFRTGFYATFASTVSYEEAFPEGGPGQGFMPLIDLEIWGLPTSKPTYDPNNQGFIYLRFQRGIMQFDLASGATQGILIGDYLKAVITGQNLPADLAQQASGSRLYRQYDNSTPGGIARLHDLPDTNMFAAFEPDGVVVPVPNPTATPVPVATTAAPTPAPAGPPATIGVSGQPAFVDQVRKALALLSDRTPAQYALVRQNVYRIDQSGDISAYNAASHQLRIVEGDAFTPAWKGFADQQAQWLAGLIVHNAVRIQQVLAGKFVNTAESTTEALWQQRTALMYVETTYSPPGQFANYLTDIINGNRMADSDFFPPRAPYAQGTPMPTR